METLKKLNKIQSINISYKLGKKYNGLMNVYYWKQNDK